MVLVVAVAMLFQADPVTPSPWLEQAPVMVIAHRGASGHAPENTLPAFQLALDMGAHALELDVTLTADGEVVLMHDPTVDRTTDGTGDITTLTLAEVKALDAGYDFTARDGSHPFRGQGIEVPTLSEVLTAFPDASVLLDVKTEGGLPLADRVVEVIRAYDAEDRVMIGAFDGDIMRRIREQLPGVTTSLAEDEGILFFALQVPGLHRWYRAPAPALQVPEYSGRIHVLTPRFVAAAHDLGMKVHVWTVNEADDIARFVDMGVDGLITDYPDRALEVLAGR
ncbi:MAG TPA: glycerophosphodiester phosphodiesterase [Bacillota bacterium]